MVQVLKTSNSLLQLTLAPPTWALASTSSRFIPDATSWTTSSRVGDGGVSLEGLVVLLVVVVLVVLLVVLLLVVVLGVPESLVVVVEVVPSVGIGDSAAFCAPVDDVG